jgi:hypothetical protein
MLSPKPLKKWTKITPKKLQAENNFAHSNKSKTLFFGHFFVDNFFPMIFRRIRNQNQIFSIELAEKTFWNLANEENVIS